MTNNKAIKRGKTVAEPGKRNYGKEQQEILRQSAERTDLISRFRARADDRTRPPYWRLVIVIDGRVRGTCKSTSDNKAHWLTYARESTQSVQVWDEGPMVAFLQNEWPS